MIRSYETDKEACISYHHTDTCVNIADIITCAIMMSSTCQGEDDGMKRMLDMAPMELTGLDRQEFLYAIRASEGRTIASETIGIAMPMLVDITNAEFAASQGADIIILNMFDCLEPHIEALPECMPSETIRCLKRLCGRPVGVNLEPCPPSSGDSIWAMKRGRMANAENARILADMGADFILVTGNPGNGVDNDAIADALSSISSAVGDRIAIAAGRMHASLVLDQAANDIVGLDDVERFASAGADIILIPAPMTVPGIDTRRVQSLVRRIHSLGRLAMTSIGTSQEGSDVDTIRRIALECKAAGADIHHIGDSGYMGMALAENIFAYSVAIRGVRHTYRRMASARR